jgi:hypothetical protein
MPVILVHKLVGEPVNNNWKKGAKEEKRHNG